MRTSLRPGSGYEARAGGGGGGGGAPAASAIEYDRPKRRLITLDDDDEEEERRAAVGAAASAAASGEVDPLDAFMATLEPPQKKQRQAETAAPAAAEEEIDPLDAFMSGLAAQTAAESSRSSAAAAAAAAAAASKRLQLDDDDAQASYLASAERRSAQRLTKLEAQAATQGVSLDALLARQPQGQGQGQGGAGALDSDDEADRDSDEGRPPRDDRDAKREVRALPPLDHSVIAYEPFRKVFYTEHPDLASLPEQEMKELTDDFDVQVSGPVRPRLCYRWEHFGFEPKLLALIKKQGFEAPTPVQAQAVPIALLGKDIIGVAKTGSGKTCAFVWPMLVHLLDQRPLEAGEGPIGIILAPTRELAEQIYTEAYKYLHPFSLRVTPVMGGMQKHEQRRALQAGTDVVVATPGRFVDLLAERACTCRRVTFLVLDEADRMLSMGFEAQLRSILGQVRPDRQTLLFSATMAGRVEKLARESMCDPAPARVMVGTGGANRTIRQVVDVLASPEDKWQWLATKLPAFLAAGAVLIFCSTIAACEELSKRMLASKIAVGTLHGDHHQAQRQSAMQRFKSGALKVLVATDVAARGLDIKGLPTVVNYDVAQSVDAHTHRIGRTGRAGKDGIAYTLLSPADLKYAGMIYDNLEEAEQEVPLPLWELAMKDKNWSRGRASSAMRGGRGGGGRGGGMAGGRGGGAVGTAGRGGSGAAFPPLYNNVPPPSAVAAPSQQDPASSLAAAIQAAQAFAAAHRSTGAGGAAALPPPPPPPSFAAAPAAPAPALPGGVHPSRLAQIPGAAAAAAAAFAAGHAAQPAHAAPPYRPPPPPQPAYSSYPPPPPPQPVQPAHQSYPPPPPQPAPSAAGMVHPSRMGLVPQTAPVVLPPPPPPPSSSYLPMPPFSAASQPFSAAPASGSAPSPLGSGAIAATQPPSAQDPPKRKSRWGS